MVFSNKYHKSVVPTFTHIISFMVTFNSCSMLVPQNRRVILTFDLNVPVDIFFLKVATIDDFLFCEN